MVTDSRKATPPARIAMHRSSKPAKKAKKSQSRGRTPSVSSGRLAFIKPGPCRPESKRKFSIGPVRGDINANSVEYASCRSQFLQTPQELVEFVGGVEVGLQFAGRKF